MGSWSDLVRKFVANCLDCAVCPNLDECRTQNVYAHRFFCRYMLVTGKVPFDGENLGALFENIAKGSFKLPDEVSNRMAPGESLLTVHLVTRSTEGFDSRHVESRYRGEAFFGASQKSPVSNCAAGACTTAHSLRRHLFPLLPFVNQVDDRFRGRKGHRRCWSREAVESSFNVVLYVCG